MNDTQSLATQTLATQTLVLQQVSLHPKIGIHPILENLSFEIRSTEIVALVGGVESGKTMLLRLLNRLQDPSQGQIYFNQHPLTAYPVVELRRKIVFVPSEPKLLGMTVRETIVTPLRLQKASPQTLQQALETWTTEFEIPLDWLDRTEVELSTAQRQRVAIARALTLRPSFLLLDEPIVHFDLDQAAQFRTQLQILSQSQGFGLVWATRHPEGIVPICNRMLHLHQGQLLLDQPAELTDWSELVQTLQAATAQEQSEWD